MSSLHFIGKLFFYVHVHTVDDAKCDVWSVGVVAYMLLSGSRPFHGETNAEILRDVKRGSFAFEEFCFNKVSANAKDFIIACLQKYPSSRPTAQEALSHKWFNMLKKSPKNGSSKHKKAVSDSSTMSHKEQKLPALDTIQRLGDHTERSFLAKIIRGVVAHTLRSEQISRLRDQFTKFDVSQTGEITIEDLQTVLTQFDGFPEGVINFLIADLDMDKSGKISYHEFLAATITNGEITEENMQIAFERMSSHSTVITSEQLQRLLGYATNTDVAEIMEEAGLERGAQLTFEDVSKP